MLAILLGTIGIFGLLFLEHFFFGLFALSIYILTAINMWGRVNNKIFFPFIALFGIALDVTMHQPLGLHILVLGVVLVIYLLFDSLLPEESNISRYVFLFFVFALYYILNLLFLSLFQDGILPSYSGRMFVNIAFNSVVSVIISVLVTRVFYSMRDSKNYERIRLR